MVDRNWKWFTFKAKAELTDVIYQHVKQQIPTSPSLFPSKILFITPPSKMCIHKVPLSHLLRQPQYIIHLHANKIYPGSTVQFLLSNRHRHVT